MDSTPENLEFFLPLLPVHGFVCHPQQTLTFHLKNKKYYQELFNYAKENTNSLLALAYLTKPRARKPSFHQVMSIVHLDEASASPYKSKSSWKIQVTALYTASYNPDRLNTALPFWRAGLKALPNIEHMPSINTSRNLLLNIWMCCRRLIAAADDTIFSVLPSRGNKYFKGYSQDLPRFLTYLYNHMPLTFEERLDYLQVQDITARAAFLLLKMNQLKKEGVRTVIVPIDYTRLCRINSDAVVSLHCN
ncbi:MAG: hypothetical protein ACI38Q_07540 [Candidatus Bruticola sp.]